MKFACECGHTIADQTDYLPYKAYLFRDQDFDRFYWDAINEIADFIAAVRAGQRDAWLTAHKFTPDWDDAGIISYSFMRKRLEHLTEAYECEECGRLYVERERGPYVSRFVEFQPGSGHVERVLASRFGPPHS